MTLKEAGSCNTSWVAPRDLRRAIRTFFFFPSGSFNDSVPAYFLGKQVCYIGMRNQIPLEKVLLKDGVSGVAGRVPDKTQGPASDKDAVEDKDAL